jgi:hypothetical protein
VTQRPEIPCLLAGLAALVLAVAARSDAQVLETETARLRLKGAVQVGSNFEYQTSTEGHEAALPLLFEYGLSDRFELVVEPVASTQIRPRSGMRASGAGDTEAAGQELVGTVGVGVHVHPKWFLSAGVSYDNTHAWLFRPGITFRSR